MEDPVQFARPKLILYALLATLLCGARSTIAATPQNLRTDLFEFHSGFWINLHHFLYRQSQLSEPRKGSHDLSLTKADTDELQQLSTEERRAWEDALSYYGRSVVQRDLLFDDELAETKNQLEDADASTDLVNVKLPAELRAVLLKAAPIYRKHWWPRHDRDNREWINRLLPLVAQYGPALSAQISRVYDEPWPAYPVRVDAVTYANWAGAYTTLEPTRPTISATDPGNQGTAALEIVFHETSHAMMGRVMDAMRSAETSLNAHRAGEAFQSGSVWHAVLFYTAGELVKEQIPDYTPYADKNGLWIRAWPPPDRSLIEQDWKPHMDGSISLQRSLTKLVNDLASSPALPH